MTETKILDSKIAEAQQAATIARGEADEADAACRQALIDNDLPKARKAKVLNESKATEAAFHNDRVETLGAHRAEAARLDAVPLFEAKLKDARKAVKAEQKLLDDLASITERLATLKPELQAASEQAGQLSQEAISLSEQAGMKAPFFSRKESADLRQAKGDFLDIMDINFARGHSVTAVNTRARRLNQERELSTTVKKEG